MNDSQLRELERILEGEPELRPMTGFSARVMSTIREEERSTEPIAFPWARFLPGFLLNLGLLLGATIWLVLELASSPSNQLLAVQSLPDPQARAWLWATLTLLGTGALAWTASRWAVRRQASYF